MRGRHFAAIIAGFLIIGGVVAALALHGPGKGKKGDPGPGGSPGPSGRVVVVPSPVPSLTVRVVIPGGPEGSAPSARPTPTSHAVTPTSQPMPTQRPSPKPTPRPSLICIRRICPPLPLGAAMTGPLEQQHIGRPRIGEHLGLAALAVAGFGLRLAGPLIERLRRWW